ncbi:MAG TPA: sel1 repeat family protein, partial [Nannocystis exedens]|nr:sel1 repeat family protein [Nannocystis exedens]
MKPSEAFAVGRILHVWGLRWICGRFLAVSDRAQESRLDAAARLVFHGIVRLWVGLVGVLVVSGVVVLGCHREKTEAPVDDGCMGAGCVEEAEAALWEGEEAAAREPLEKLCDDDNDAFSCFRLAVLHEEGLGGQKDIPKAAHYFERACELDHEEGCERRFELAARQNDTAAELEYAKQACEGGRPLGCMASAAILNEGRAGARDKEQAIELYEKACGVGDADGCAMAGDLLFDP